MVKTRKLQGSVRPGAATAEALLGLMLAIACANSTAKELAPSGLAYSTNPALYTVGTTISANVPSSTGGPVVSYAVSPVLPPGLGLNPATGMITGTPTAISPGTMYTVTGRNSGGSTTADVWLAVNDMPPRELAYPMNPAVYTAGMMIAPNVPTNQGGAVVSYSVSPALPPGLDLNTVTGVISGTALALANAAYLVTAVNSGGSASAYVSIRVNPPPPPAIISQPSSSAAFPGQTVTFSVVASGTGVLQYQWSENGTAIVGATSASYVTPPATGTDNASTFSVAVSDAFGGSTVSRQALLSVQQFVATGPMASPRYGHSATLLATGNVLVAGGNDGTGQISSAELYDPVAGTFAAPVSMSMTASRERHTATHLGDGRVLITGGYTRRGGYADPAEVYNPTANQFAQTAAMGTARAYHTATLLPNGKVLVVGGLSTGGRGTQLYDSAAGTFSSTGDTLVSRTFHSATLLSNGKVLIAGGHDGTSYLPGAELYDPATGTFAVTGFMSTPRGNHAATLLPGGQVLISGGQNSNILATAELYDPSTESFTPAGSLASSRAYPTATLLNNGMVLVVGGNNTPSAEVFDPSAETFTPAVPMSTDRRSHTAVLLPSGKVLVAGGVTQGGITASAELWSSPP